MSDMPPPPPPPNVEIVAVQPPRDYMALAIVATVVGFCTSCIGLITGIIAIVMASKSRKAYAMGDVVTGASAASTAKTLIIVTFVIAILGLVINLIMLATGNFYYSFNSG